MSGKKINSILEQLAGHETRLSALEKKAGTKISEYLVPEITDHAGPKGGTLLLIKEGTFRKKQTVEAVKEVLEGMGYFYHKDVVRNTLNRLSTPRGPLTVIKEGKSKVYVERR
jgi:hypothetical protein